MSSKPPVPPASATPAQNPAEIAREAFRRLATHRIAPTPRARTDIHHEIAGDAPAIELARYLSQAGVDSADNYLCWRQGHAAAAAPDADFSTLAKKLLMMTSEDILSIYESMLALTGQMLLAAGNNDWDHVGELEQRCSAHVKTLREQEQTQGQGQAMQGAGRDKKVAILKQLLSDDRQIRDLATPWMAHLSALMHSSSAQRRVANAYTA